MTSPTRQLDATGLEEAFYRLYREFFDQAERKRRWSIRDDIPWHQVNRAMPPAVANVVESFCAVELYLHEPDGFANRRHGRALGFRFDLAPSQDLVVRHVVGRVFARAGEAVALAFE